MVLVIKSALALLSAFNSDPIVTDRPDFTESSLVVGVGRVQVESGATFEPEAFSLPEVLVRAGLARKLELRIGLPNYQRIDLEDRRVEGFGDIYVGAKVQLGPLRDGTEMALIPAVLLPTGREGIRAESSSFELKVCFSRELSGGHSLSGMLAATAFESDGDWIESYLGTLSYGLPLADKVGMFIEYVLDFESGRASGHFIHSGFTYQPKPNLQLDFHYGFGASPSAPATLVGAGLSIRF